MVHPEQVAAYLAKYLTKATEDFGLPSRILSAQHAERVGATRHAVRIIETAERIAGENDAYYRLVACLATLGFRGHPITKSRAYSVTFGQIRQARRRHRSNPAGLDPRRISARSSTPTTTSPRGSSSSRPGSSSARATSTSTRPPLLSHPPCSLALVEGRIKPKPLRSNSRREEAMDKKCRAGSSNSGRSKRSPPTSRCHPRPYMGGAAASMGRRATGSGTKSATGLRKCVPGWMPRACWLPRLDGTLPLPIGSWGLIRTEPVGQDGKGRPQRHRARAYYRDFDGVTRLVESSGRTPTMATNSLRQKLQNRTLAGRHGDLTAMTRFSDAAALWLTKVDEMVTEGRRSPGTVETYRRQLKNHVLPAMGEVRLGEATTPLVDKVVGAIKADVSAATAKSCRSVISGVMGLAVRYGAILANPGPRGRADRVTAETPASGPDARRTSRSC